VRPRAQFGGQHRPSSTSPGARSVSLPRQEVGCLDDYQPRYHAHRSRARILSGASGRRRHAAVVWTQRAYYIGRLYGKNTTGTPRSHEHLDRVGLWLSSGRQDAAAVRRGLASGWPSACRASSCSTTLLSHGGTRRAADTVSQRTASELADLRRKPPRTSATCASARHMEGTIGNLRRDLSEFLSSQELQFTKERPPDFVETRDGPLRERFLSVNPTIPSAWRS